MQRLVNPTAVEVRFLEKQRGALKYDIWTGYASKAGFEFALKSMPIAQLLILLEADPEIMSYTLNQLVARKKSELVKSEDPDAICICENSSIIWYFLSNEFFSNSKRKSCKNFQIPDGVTSRIITYEYLDKKATLLKNWRRGLCYLKSALNYDLSPYIKDIKSLLAEKGELSLESIFSLLQSKDQSLLIASVFLLSQKREVLTDMDFNELGFGTLVQGRLS
ncbi:hypothetical protein GTP46_05760 [Duganella sp. FT135W]|uniref:Uncharacterized protein n=1 Tax=Duganella flavida TaxID=2692175 RepID=A0A6L8K7E8_9BURK|nr:hypothetical protein [Duganella flavida]MYM22148.1 hypothetical protein [Duganella flavida]